MAIEEYIDSLKRELSTGNALEHSYRPAFKKLIELLDSNITAVNEPTRSEHGAPDFIFLDRRNTYLIRGYSETKDVYVDLDNIEKTEQLKRYLGYSNLILTNYLEFRFFRNGEKYQTITVAKKDGLDLIVFEDNYVHLEKELKSFLEDIPENITNAKRLAEIMGGKAARIRNNVINYLETNNENNKELLRIFKIMKDLLVHDLEQIKFADMYAQTLVYGLFVARYYDETPDNFTRQEARDLIPGSNPFLRHFFDHIVGPDFDRRLTYIVDELCEVFSVSDVSAIIQKHYDSLGEEIDKDPIIHFYEDFLKEYDPKLRKQMGAYYTPVPIVHFIIRAVDEVLKKEFNLPGGLADTSKIEQKYMLQGTKSKRLIHKVQLLDPAVGTATFLNEVIKFIYSSFDGQEGLWESYVEKELLPRLYGFELMMAPYTIAHLKLAMTLKETGIDYFERRLGVYLTNTLEEGIKAGQDLFSFGLAEAISEEAKSANFIKQDTPIMVIVGNPPYSGESFNKGPYAMKLVEKYKLEPGGKEKLQERNPKWINDDYVKFIAFAQEMISKNGEGIVAMITNHGFLDNPTFRGMRWSLLDTFSSIYIVDLHGNVKKREVSSDGGIDENVFNIQQGVSIIIAIKNKNNSKRLSNVYRYDLKGRRRNKFEFLHNNGYSQIEWDQIRLKEPSYLFLNKDEKLQAEYAVGLKIDDIFINNSLAFQTHRDAFSICNTKEEVVAKIKDFRSFELTDEQLLTKYSLKNQNNWLKYSRDKIRNNLDHESLITQCSYRPFDDKWTYFDESFSDRPRSSLKLHYLNKNNFSIEVSKQISNTPWQHILVADKPSESCLVSNKTKEGNYSFLLYHYPNSGQQLSLGGTNRIPNLKMNSIKTLLKNVGSYTWINEREEKDNIGRENISPLDVFDYIYGVLHAPSYRERYKDFLKNDFPRVPIAKNKDKFWQLVVLGGKLRGIHLMKNLTLSNFRTTFSTIGNNHVEKIEFNDKKIYINKLQYFGNIEQNTWEFCIGGYQPAQKWLKDRKGKKLEYDDITHYQGIIAVLTETQTIMEEIDKVLKI